MSKLDMTMNRMPIFNYIGRAKESIPDYVIYCEETSYPRILSTMHLKEYAGMTLRLRMVPYYYTHNGVSKTWFYFSDMNNNCWTRELFDFIEYRASELGTGEDD